MAFLELTFPPDVAAGAVAGLGRRTEVVTVGAGWEERNQRWADSRRTYQAGLGLRSAADLAAVVALFEEARGRANSFRFRDWSDFSSATPGAAPSAADQRIGTGDGAAVQFQLRKGYGTLNTYWRTITKPEPGTVRVSVGGVEAGAGWAVDHATGLVTFETPPADGAAIRAGFLFHVPVRFAADRLEVDLRYFDPAGGGSGSVPDVGLVEVLE